MRVLAQCSAARSSVDATMSAACSSVGPIAASLLFGADRLDVVAIGVEQEGRVVGRRIVGAHAWAPVLVAARAQARSVELPHHARALRTQSDVRAGTG